MRSEQYLDQADGLRRMLMGNQTRMLSIIAGKAGVGRTSITINLAAALARAGKDVLVLDENHAPGNLVDRLMLSSRYDLLDVAHGHCEIQQAVLRSQGYAILSAARAMSGLKQMSATQQARLEQAVTAVSSGVDVLLVDGAVSAGLGSPSSSMVNGISLLVVVDATASGITESYTLIKRLALENAKLNFEIVINRVVDEQAALTVFENMDKVARLHLSARLEYAGYIPLDDRQKRATQLGRSVVEAFPTSPSALAYVALAQQFLNFPVSSDESAESISGMMQSLMRQTRGAAQMVGRDHVYR